MLIYSDKDILAVNKGCGTPVQPGPTVSGSLIETLSEKYGKLYPVHRIDTPASGIVVFARTKKASAALSKQFSDGKSVEKIYLCAVDARPPAEEGRLEDHILIPSARKTNKVFIRREPGKNTRKAALDYRLAYKTDRYFILEIRLLTGRKHQIRAQLANAGCHIKGDIKYGARRTNRGGGIHLHALSLSFRHPRTDEPLSLTAPLPDEPLWKAAADELSLPACSEQQDD